jgi:hypothetical protein
MRMIGTACLAALLVFQPAAAGAADSGIRSEQVQFAEGATSKVIAGRLRGDQIVDYRLRAGAGQTLTVTLQSGNGQNYFNLNPPGSDVAMFVGSSSGERFSGILPTDGEYTVRVYLMRAAARRNESASYKLTVAVSGKPLAPLPAKQDALIRGTPFHASAIVPCAPPFNTQQVKTCEAFVIRRGFDGTATVEIRWPQGFKRRILFVKGQPVAADAPEPLTSSRQGDVTVVGAGSDERFEIPDALLFGG